MDDSPDLLKSLRANLAAERRLTEVIGAQVVTAIGLGWTYRALAAEVDAPHTTLWDRAQAHRRDSRRVIAGVS